MKLVVLLIIFISLQVGCAKYNQKEIAINKKNVESNQPETLANSEIINKYVSDEQTAIEIAVNAWIQIYGKEKIESEKPYHANLKNGIWFVSGSLTEDMDGGVAEAQISQKDGKILKIIHGK